MSLICLLIFPRETKIFQNPKANILGLQHLEFGLRSMSTLYCSLNYLSKAMFIVTPLYFKISYLNLLYIGINIYIDWILYYQGQLITQIFNRLLKKGRSAIRMYYFLCICYAILLMPHWDARHILRLFLRRWSARN